MVLPVIYPLTLSDSNSFCPSGQSPGIWSLPSCGLSLLCCLPTPCSMTPVSWSCLSLSLTIQLIPFKCPSDQHLHLCSLQLPGWYPLGCHFHHLCLILPHAQQFVFNMICSALSAGNTAALSVGAGHPWLRHRTDSHSRPVGNDLAECQGLYLFPWKEGVHRDLTQTQRFCAASPG